MDSHSDIISSSTVSCTHHRAFDLSGDVAFQVVVQWFAETEIRNLCVEMVVEKDVVGLDIPMDYSGVCELMQVGETSGCIECYS